MKCSNCREGTLSSTTVERRLDHVFGVPVLVRGLPVLVCPKCEAETMIGSVIDELSIVLVGVLLESGAPLRPREIKFLRGALGFTQEGLAKHLGVSRVAVARWETKDGLLDGPQALALRSLVFFRLRRAHPDLASVAESFTRPPRPQRKSRRYELEVPRPSAAPC
jgi:DNA-binding transcriptional regulator YiaG